MTYEERLSYMRTMLGSCEDTDDVLSTYLNIARQKIINHRFPYGTSLVEVEPRYEMKMIELAIVLYNERGAEGQVKHNENGVSREWKTEEEILASIPRQAGLPL